MKLSRIFKTDLFPLDGSGSNILPSIDPRKAIISKNGVSETELFNIKLNDLR
jgi:hypothetical protein